MLHICRRVPLVLVCLILAGLPVQAQTIPDGLSYADFREISAEFSEPDGIFQVADNSNDDNLVSNETFAPVIPELTQTAKTGGAFLGVGPEQNFHYIAAIRPRIAFIIDIRRGNLNMAERHQRCGVPS